MELDYLGRYVVEQRCRRDKVLRDTHHMCRHSFHREAALHCYAMEMESVVLMSDHVGEEYSKALVSELSTDNEGRRS